MGRKCTFDDLEESTFISERTHERFFQQFIIFGSSDLYSTQFVRTPQTNEEIETHMHEMKQAGYPGAGGSTDATNVVILNCRYGHRQAHPGPKMSKTSRTHNATVSHRRRILSSSSGQHPSRWNDKTLILYDDFVVRLKEGTILEDYEFNLYEYGDNDTDIITVRYKGRGMADCRQWISELECNHTTTHCVLLINIPIDNR